MMEPQGMGIWTYHQPLKLLGAEIGTRMTIMDYSGQGDLLIHSAINPTEDVVSAVKKLGNVRHIVAPNRWHHLYAKRFKKVFPEAKLFLAPGLEKKRPDIQYDEILENDKQYAWSSSVPHQFIRGCPIFNEFIFHHKASKSIVVTDIGMNIGPDSPLFTRVAFMAMGNYNKFGWSGVEKLIFIRNKTAFKDSIGKVLDWDFDQILLPHGRIVKSNGHSLFRGAFA